MKGNKSIYIPTQNRVVHVKFNSWKNGFILRQHLCHKNFVPTTMQNYH